MKTYDRHELQEFKDLLSLCFSIGEKLDLEWLALTDLPDGLKWPQGKTAVIHPGCGVDGTPREWLLTKYGLLAHWLMKHHGFNLIFTGGPDEPKKTSDLNKLIGGLGLDLGGKLSWKQTAAVLSRADLVISGNTGVMHLAAALKKSQIALHGPTNPVLWGPLNPKAVVIQSDCPNCPCLRLGFEYHAFDQSCMDRIDLQRVKEAVDAMFDI
jgi:ADP-heptose:LPS heptosyltransferase